MATPRRFIDAFHPPYELSPLSYFDPPVLENTLYTCQILLVMSKQGCHIRYVLLRTVLGVEDPHASAQNNAALLQTRVSPPNRPFALQFQVTGWLPGYQLRLANFLPVYWPIVVGNGFAAYFVAYSLADSCRLATSAHFHRQSLHPSSSLMELLSYFGSCTCSVGNFVNKSFGCHFKKRLWITR